MHLFSQSLLEILELGVSPRQINVLEQVLLACQSESPTVVREVTERVDHHFLERVGIGPVKEPLGAQEGLRADVELGAVGESVRLASHVGRVLVEVQTDEAVVLLDVVHVLLDADFLAVAVDHAVLQILAHDLAIGLGGFDRVEVDEAVDDGESL